MATGTPARGAGGNFARTDGWRSVSLPPCTAPDSGIASGYLLPQPDAACVLLSALPKNATTAQFVLGNYFPAFATPGARTDANSDLAVHGPAARAAYGVSGAGIKIGILSDSFNLLGGMAGDVARGDLPAGVTILQDGPPGSHDEGRAMGDLVHKIAPGAQLYFHTATAGEANFAAGIAQLVAAGCTIIVDDVAYLDEPFFQDGGAVQAAVESAIAHGVNYFTAASNEGTDYIQQAFRGVHASLPGLPANALVQNFAGSGAAQLFAPVSVPPGGQLLLDLQWDQPFASIGTGHASANSLGMALYSLSGQLLAAASVNCTGGNPDQILSFKNTTGASAFRLVVWQNGGAAPPGLFKVIEYGNGSFGGRGIGVGSGTVIGQEMVPGANTVGAVAWNNTRAFGGNNAIEAFSSVGSGNMLFDASGARLASPISTAKVNFTAPDGSITSVFAPFYGTSAAAPNAAAVAALMLQASPRLTPAQLSAILASTASPGGGGAVSGGAGLIQADAAVAAALALGRLGAH